MNVTTFFENHMLVILPEVFLLISASTLLLIGVGLTTDRGEGYPNMVKPTLWLSVYVILLTGLLIQNNPVPSAVLFNGAVVHDGFTNVAKTILLLSTAACLSIAVQYVKKEGLHAYEFGVLVLFSLAGMMALVSSFDLISFYLSDRITEFMFLHSGCIQASLCILDRVGTEVLHPGSILFWVVAVWMFFGVRIHWNHQL